MVSAVDCKFLYSDETVVIRINLATGHERSVSRDRFLILYQRIDSDVDVTEFWACHTSKESRFEHRQVVTSYFARQSYTFRAAVAKELCEKSFVLLLKSFVKSFQFL